MANIQVYMSAESKEKIKQHSKKEYRKMSPFIVRIVEEYIRDQEKKENPT